MKGLVVPTHLNEMNMGEATTTLSFLVCMRNDSGVSDVDPISERLYVMASSACFGQRCAEAMTKYSLSSLLILAWSSNKKISYYSIKENGTRAKHFDILEKLAQFF